MNILYIEHYASPDDWGMEHRPFRFARRWIAMGHRVLIIAASFTHLRSRNPEVDGPFCRMEWEGVPFLFVRTPRYEGNGRKRCGNILAFLYGIDRFYEKMTGSFSPDVILVGEMRDLETISTALTAAETGHLVLSTLHTIGADKTIDRIIDVFPPNQQQQVRIQLASVLECIISQQLIRREDGRGRVAALEVLFANTAIRNMIRENKTYQIISTMQTGKRQGMQTMDDAIYELFLRGDISADSAVSYAQDPVNMSSKVNFDML